MKRARVNETNNRFNRAIRVAIAVVCVLSCSATIAFAVRAYNSAANPALSPSGSISPQPSEPVIARQSISPTKGPVQLVRFTLYDVGIFPREAYATRGLVAISIEDLSGGTSGLVVERQTGNAPERQGLVTRAENEWRGRNDLKLESGQYVVYMADRPDNRATLIVEP